ncbi:MAG: SoxY-related AACIE arm protein [Betaproteobacteria bacterium]|nr:SoxY-related AACIE arm protein [Betaproteobacteria bacterium]MDH3435840.1 SoxY-related AACIE arm protein [Betaproteobacteria bacterium]
MTSRRDFLVTAGNLAGGLVLASAAGAARATPAAMQEAIRKVVGSAQIRRGRVKLEVAPLIDNGNVVPLAVAVESPMTPADHVKAIHVFAEKNPLPNVLSIYLGARAGRARVVTRIRLADTQTVTAIAELSDGSFWTETADVVVTLSACLEEVV